MHPSFIVIEGPDGSGTTTHSKILAERLNAEGKKIHLTQEPSGNPIGKLLRSLLAGSSIPSDALQLLFTADRAWHLFEEIEPALKKSMSVVSEQYILSTLIFGGAAGLDKDWLIAANSQFRSPDAQVILLPPFEECVRRWSDRDSQEILEEERFQSRVYDLYTSYAAKFKIPIIDTSKKREDVADEIYTHVMNQLSSKKEL